MQSSKIFRWSFSGSAGRVCALGGVVVACVLAAGCQANRGQAMAANSNTVATPSLPQVETVKVVSRRLDTAMPLPGELRPYEFVDLYPKVTGFVQWIGVDRGSRVKQGQLLVQLVAPELVAQMSEAQAKLASAEHREVAEQAKLAADQATYQRLKQAAATPGVISEEELEDAQKAAESDLATVVSLHAATVAAKDALQSVQTLESYLRVTAPFDGMITTRYVHPGALVGPSSGRTGETAHPMLRLEEVAHLRLIVPVPEAYVAGVAVGQDVTFTVAAFPGRTFSGKVARISDSLNAQTRTMPVELDIWNPNWTLHSGMFPQVQWPVRRPYSTLFVPQSAVVRSMESTFVIQVRDGVAQWVDVQTGVTSGNLTEVFGHLHAGDEVALQASEELRSNTRVDAKLAPAATGGTALTERTAPGE
jgi:membrane fusion protein, multidrug efflux system